MFFNTPQSNTRQDYAKANGVNALVFLSIEMQPAFRPLIAHQALRIDKNSDKQNFEKSAIFVFKQVRF